MLLIQKILVRLRDIVMMGVAMAILTPIMTMQLPGGYCSHILSENVSKTTIETCKHRLEPSIFLILGDTFRRYGMFDLGDSLRTGQPVIEEIAYHLPYTIRLSIVSFMGSFFGGLLTGLYSVKERHFLRGKFVNYVGMFVLSLPSFIIALFLLQTFTLKYKFFTILSNNQEWKSLLLPSLAIIIPLGAWFMRLTRSAMINVLDQGYIRTARAKGLSEWRVFGVHALKNAFIALLPQIGLVLGGLLDGSLLIEIIFNRPGLGRYTFDALLAGDYVVIQGVMIIVTIMVAIANLSTDILYVALLPHGKEAFSIKENER